MIRANKTIFRGIASKSIIRQITKIYKVEASNLLINSSSSGVTQTACLLIILRDNE